MSQTCTSYLVTGPCDLWVQNPLFLSPRDINLAISHDLHPHSPQRPSSPGPRARCLQIYGAQPPATQWQQSTPPCTLVYIQVPFQDDSPRLIFTITNPWFHPSKMKLTHVTLSIPPLEDVSPNIITLDYGHCHSPKTLAPILCPSCPSTAIITLTSLRSIQTRA